MGIAIGPTELAKWAIHRTRPDASDRKSFWSGHTSNAVASSGWNYSVGVPVAAAAGLLRGGAAKHFLSDIGVGALDGALAIWICRRVNPAEEP
jgi:hypothetical protein